MLTPIYGGISFSTNTPFCFFEISHSFLFILYCCTCYKLYNPNINNIKLNLMFYLLF